MSMFLLPSYHLFVSFLTTDEYSGRYETSFSSGFICS